MYNVTCIKAFPPFFDLCETARHTVEAFFLTFTVQIARKEISIQRAPMRTKHFDLLDAAPR